MDKQGWWRFFSVYLVVSLLLSAARPARAQKPINLRIDNVDTSAFSQVKVRVSVRNNNGVPVTGLTVDDFEIGENGAGLKPTDLQSVVRSDVQLAVALAIDISGSMRANDAKPLQDAKAAANAFLDIMAQDDLAAAIAFGGQVDLGEPFPQIDPEREVGFTYDKNALRNVINFLDAQECAGTPLYDAAFKAVRMTAAQPRGNRAVILMTDGRDAKGVLDDSGICREATPGSEVATSEDPIAEANRNNIPVFTIGLGENIDEGYLRRLALRTGGTYQQTPDSAQLTELYLNIADLLRQQYVLTYTSQVTEDTAPVTEEGQHSLVVRVTYSGIEAFDEAKFRRPGAQPAPTEAAEAVAQATAVPTQPAPTAVPASGDEEAGAMTEFVEENRALVVVAGGLTGLLLILLLVFLVLRQRQSDEEAWALDEFPTDFYDEGVMTPAEDEAVGEPFQETPLPPTQLEIDEPELPAYEPPSEAPDLPATKFLGAKPKSVGFFIVKEGPRPGRQITLEGADTRIGRGPSNDIVLDDATVSREHAAVKLEDDDFHIYDLGSANGTLVGGQEIAKHQLQDGDEVMLGDTVLVFKVTKLKG